MVDPPPVAPAGPVAVTWFSLSTCTSLSTSSTVCSFLSLLEHMFFEIPWHLVNQWLLMDVESS